MPNQTEVIIKLAEKNARREILLDIKDKKFASLEELEIHLDSVLRAMD